MMSYRGALDRCVDLLGLSRGQHRIARPNVGAERTLRRLVLERLPDDLRGRSTAGSQPLTSFRAPSEGVSGEAAGGLSQLLHVLSLP
jgi:hypothetical protein